MLVMRKLRLTIDSTGGGDDGGDHHDGGDYNDNCDDDHDDYG